MSIDELAATHSERQIGIWAEKLRADFNRPSRSDFYLMQLTAEVYRSWLAEKDKAPDLNKFKLGFGEGTDTPKEPEKPKEPEPEKITPEQMRLRRKNATQAAQMKWFSIGGPPKGV